MARVTENDFFDAALATLSECGFPFVTAAGLCQRLGVTRGSFYHHFDSFDDFIGGLMSYWRRTYTEDLVTRARAAEGSLIERLRAHVRLAASLPHDAEIALRAWGTVNSEVHDALHQVDELRVVGLASTLEEYGLAPAVASRYSRLSIAALVGAQMTRDPLTEEYLDDILAMLQRDIASEVKPAHAPLH